MDQTSLRRLGSADMPVRSWHDPVAESATGVPDCTISLPLPACRLGVGAQKPGKFERRSRLSSGGLNVNDAEQA